MALFDRADYAQAWAYFTADLANTQQAGDEWAQAMTLVNMGTMATKLGDYAQAQKLIEDALALHRRVGQTWGLAKTLVDQGTLQIQLKQFAQARHVLTECQALCQELWAKDLRAGVK